MGMFKRMLHRKTKPEPEPVARDVGYPIMPERTDPPMRSVEDIAAGEAALKVMNGEVQILDVRFEHEYRRCHIPGALLIPLPVLAERYQELNAEAPIVVVCEHGMRSVQACRFLDRLGFKKLYNMLGGMSVYPGPKEGAEGSSH